MARGWELDLRLDAIGTRIGIDLGCLTSMDPLSTGFRALEMRVRHGQQLLASLRDLRRTIDAPPQ